MDAVPTPPPAVTAPAPAPLAHGRDPRWTLTRDGDALILAVAGRPALRLENRGWQDTPQGRRLAMRTADGRAASLVVVHALCAPGESTDLVATLTIDGRRLTGCLAGGGARPYPGS